MAGTMNLCYAIRRTDTVKLLGLAGCDINDEAMLLLKEALAANGSVISLGEWLLGQLDTSCFVHLTLSNSLMS
jgi:hypothetical protein